MDPDKFESEYAKQAVFLQMVSGRLRELLEECLVSLNDEKKLSPDPRLFRTRLKEVRVKSSSSLYDKINNDRKLSFKDAFKPGHVADLIGARIVCHNLSDVHQLSNLFKQGHWPKLRYLEPPDGEKDWVERGHLNSGYRGWHGLVEWKVGEVTALGEVQLRTLVQDAWASFMHDDVYKTKARSVLSSAMFEHLRLFSDLLYTVDRMAQGLRVHAESGTLSPSSHIHLLEAFNNSMLAMLDFRNRGLAVPTYLTVVRTDEYRIDGTDGHYHFDFEGHLATPERFIFPIAGDTIADNYEATTVRRQTKSGWLDISKDSKLKAELSPKTPRTVVLVHTPKTKHHRYQVGCKWKGIFEQEVEYIWCPWRDMYAGANLEYHLRVIFSSKPRLPPRLYALEDVRTLRQIMTDFLLPVHTLGREPNEYLPARGKHTYLFDESPCKYDYLCLFSA